MKILAIEKENPEITSDQFKVHAEAEARKVWEHYQNEKIREVYFRQDINCAVLVLECKDLGEAGQVLDSLPYVRQGLITFDVIPLKPYPGFSRLFK
ncbi:MAG: superoxide dismutase [Candidatus Hodarchaeales archaeon]